ncbi:putative hemolysin-III channel protein Izh2 [Trematosphaeria pertusa]|uniref:Putative hemolysin-III channel protein Izh2 n=1 Tax=Trematosphaeria pertusa TaxID=390896 RepID=A0A6A6HVE1_9PLEO|nr:putative hemolysin-III channel protein Izh2 [Trematosphaeria pertusa]KAF2241533.1 putative hemolysin-III channel protein Izh2 [Trematosphaeria pertusa]
MTMPRRKVYKTLSWDQIAPWQRDNHFLVRGYRKESNSLYDTFASLGYLHNETINIYSHLIGAIVFLWIGAGFYRDLEIRYPYSTQADIYAFAAFILSCATCFLLSALCHLLSSHSVPGARLGTTLDYLGIVVFIEGTCLSGFYYGLREHVGLLYFYWLMILAVGMACIIATLDSKFHTPAWRHLRATLFVSLGLLSIFPILHGIYIYGFGELERMMGLRWSAVQGFFYILGCVIFSTCVPERWYPERFDFFGASHQLFHFCALTAAAAQLKALIVAFDYVHRYSRH